MRRGRGQPGGGASGREPLQRPLLAEAELAVWPGSGVGWGGGGVDLKGPASLSVRRQEG